MKKVAAASAATEKSYQAIAATLEEQGVVAGNMFGMSTLKMNGKAFCGLFGDAMVFKLKGPAHAAALELAGAELFDPSGMGRAMKEWVVVPAAHRASWKKLGEQAVTAVIEAEVSAPKKKAVKKKAAKKKR